MLNDPSTTAVLSVFDPETALRVPDVNLRLMERGRHYTDATVRVALAALAKGGLLQRSDRGLYALPGYEAPPLDVWVLQTLKAHFPGALRPMDLVRLHKQSAGATLPPAAFAECGRALVGRREALDLRGAFAAARP